MFVMVAERQPVGDAQRAVRTGALDRLDLRRPHDAIARTDTAAARWSLPILAAAAFAFAVLWPQTSLHHADSQLVLRYTADGTFRHPWHLLALVPFGAMRAVLAPFDLEVRTVCRVVTALGYASTVLAAGLLARGAGLPRARVVLAAGLTATMPSVAYFGTIIELQAAQMAAAAMAMVVYAACLRAPTWPRILATAAATAIAAGVHSTNHVLVVAVPLLALAGVLPARAFGRWPTFAAVAVLHFAAYLAKNAFWALPTERVALQMVAAVPGPMDLGGDLLHALWPELLLPFAPCLFLGWMAWRDRAQRAAVGALGVLALGGVLIAAILLTRDAVERGAYLLFLAAPAALVLARSVKGPFEAAALLLVGIGVSVALRLDQASRRPNDPGVAAGALGLAAPRPVLFVSSDVPTLDSIHLYATSLHCLDLTGMAHGDSAVSAALTHSFDEQFGKANARTGVIDEPT
jgi:hypothetical protein